MAKDSPDRSNFFLRRPESDYRFWERFLGSISPPTQKEIWDQSQNIFGLKNTKPIK